MTSNPPDRWPPSVAYTRAACEIEQAADRTVTVTYHQVAAPTPPPEPYDDADDWAAPPATISDEAFAGFVALPIVAALALAVLSGKVRYTGLGHMLDSLAKTLTVVIVTVVAGWILLRPKAPRRRPSGAVGRAVRVRVHGHGYGSMSSRADVARHEGGHAIVARVLGGRVRVAQIFRGLGGGRVRATIPNSPRAAIAFLHAGQAAAGTAHGADIDDAEINRVAREIPHRERAAQVRAGRADGERIVRQHRGEITRYANKLERRGTLRG